MTLPAKPRLKAHFAVETIGDALFLLAERKQLTFEGAVFVALAPLLDGTRGFADLMLALAGGDDGQSGFPPQALFSALTALSRRGALVDGPAMPDAAFWDAADALPRADAPAATVAVTNFTDLTADEIGLALAAVGLTVAETAPMRLVLVTDELDGRLAVVNQQQRDQQQPWLLAKLGMNSLVGPLFGGDGPGCWDCWQHRRRANRQIEHHVQQQTGVAPMVTRAAVPHALPLHWAALELAKWHRLAAPKQAPSAASSAAPSAANTVWQFDGLTLAITAHRFMTRPQCPVCGDGGRDTLAFRPLALASQPKIDGSDRQCSAHDAFQRLEPLISPITGIVTALQSRGPTHSLVHNYVAGHYFPVPLGDINQLRLNRIARSGGKGSDDLAAKMGALGEAIERYCGIRWRDEPTITATLADLGDDAIHPHALLNFSEAQYAQRAALNAAADSAQQFVPAPFDESRTIAWSPAWSLTHENRRWLPTAYCFYGHRDVPNTNDGLFCRCDSNGCAAGATRTEAIFQGLLELIERDSVALWWYNRASRPAVDGASFALPLWREMQRYYTGMARDLHVLDLTTDLGVPTFAAVSRALTRPTQDIVIGFGSHLDPKKALQRALTEANQYLPALHEQHADGSTRYRLSHVEVIRWWQTATYEAHPYLVPSPTAPLSTAADFAPPATADLADDVAQLVATLAARGLETLVVDQTRPDVDLAVVRVVVPGLRHFWRRLGSGRLYDVPVALGWCAAPTPEAELNPVSCFV